MWHKSQLFLAVVALLLVASVSAAVTSNAITTGFKPESRNLPDHTNVEGEHAQGLSKLSLGLHLAPATFPHDNPFNVTEEQALEHGINIIPVDKEHWNALVNSRNLDDSAKSNAHDLQRARREVDPPDPTDWCTPNKDVSQCTFGAWCHGMGRKDVPRRAWVFFNDCELTGDLHRWAWGKWENIYSGLPWVTVFYVHSKFYPWLKYAGREWNDRSSGWELYYPYGTAGQYYYRRYFDCSG